MDVGAVRDQGASDHSYLAAVIDQMPVGIGIFDRFGGLVHANEPFVCATGAILSLTAMAQEGWRAFARDGSPLEEAWWPGNRALVGQLATVMVDFVRETACGLDLLVAMSALPLMATHGGVMGAVVIVKAIADRPRSPQPQSRDGHFRRFAENSRNAFLIGNLETGKIDYMSPAAHRIWQGGEALATLADWAQSVHPDDRAKALNSRQMASRGDARNFEYRIVGAEGCSPRQLRESCFPIPGEAGEPDCIGAIIEVISPDVQIYLVRERGDQPSDLLGMLGHESRRVQTLFYHEDLNPIADFNHSGCVVVDLRNIDTNAEAITSVMHGRPADLPVIFVARADAPADHVIAAMRAGAQNFLLAPFSADQLSKAVRDATTGRASQQDETNDDRHVLVRRLANLPRREREVLLGLIGGGTNKSIARQLGISPRTVEAHRAHLMDRLNVRTLAELLQVAHAAGLRAN